MTKFGTYTPKDCKDYENKIRAAYLEKGVKPFSGEVYVEITTFRALPKSRPKKIESEPDTFKPDCDNIAKLVLDALNGVAYEDDSQVTSLHTVKMPRERVEERIIVTVGEIG